MYTLPSQKKQPLRTYTQPTSKGPVKPRPDENTDMVSWRSNCTSPWLCTVPLAKLTYHEALEDESLLPSSQLGKPICFHSRLHQTKRTLKLHLESIFTMAVMSKYSRKQETGTQRIASVCSKSLQQILTHLLILWVSRLKHLDTVQNSRDVLFSKNTMSKREVISCCTLRLTNSRLAGFNH